MHDLNVDIDHFFELQHHLLILQKAHELDVIQFLFANFAFFGYLSNLIFKEDDCSFEFISYDF